MFLYNHNTFIYTVPAELTSLSAVFQSLCLIALKPINIILIINQTDC